MSDLIKRIPRPYLGFVALLFLVGATACEPLIQEGARDAVQADRDFRDREDAELGPLRDRLETIQFDEIEPLQRELEDLHREMERIQRLEIDPLWNNSKDPWAVGGELYQKQEALQRQYDLIDAEIRQIEVESRALEREYRDSDQNFGGLDPLVRQKEDQRYDLQRELDRLYRFGQGPIDEIWDKVNSLQSNPGGTFDTNQFEIDRLNNKIAGLHDQANWLQQDADQRVVEKQNQLNDVRNQLDEHLWSGRADIEFAQARVDQFEAELEEATVVTVSETVGSSEEIDALRAERDVLLNLLSADLAQVDSDLEATNAERDSTVASYQATIDAKNQEISLLSESSDTTASSTDSTASSTPVTTFSGNEEQIAALQAEITQAETDRDDALVVIDARLNALRASKDSLSAERQRAIDELNEKIFALQGELTQTVSTTSVPDGLNEELAELKLKVAGLEDEYNAETDRLNSLVASIQNEIDQLHGDGGQVSDVYEEIETLQAQVNALNLVSEQKQLERNDAVNTLTAEADRLQRQLNADIRFVEEQLFNIDDELAGLYRDSENDNYEAQIGYNEAQRKLEDRRYDLDDQRWLLDQQQQDLYSQNNDPWQEIQAEADRLYATRIQPIQEEIFLLEDELRSLYDEQRSLERELRVAERNFREQERDLRDAAVDDFLDFADGDPATGDGPGVEDVIDDAIDEIVDPLGDRLIENGAGAIGSELDGLDGLFDAAGNIDPADIDDPALIPPTGIDGSFNPDGTPIDDTAFDILDDIDGLLDDGSDPATTVGPDGTVIETTP